MFDAGIWSRFWEQPCRYHTMPLHCHRIPIYSIIVGAGTTKVTPCLPPNLPRVSTVQYQEAYKILVNMVQHGT